jgi:hypothetical protein
MKEIFEIIPSFPDYEVSNCGRVKTRSRMVRYIHARTGKEHWRVTEKRFLKEHFNDRTGYKFYQLYRDKKMYNRAIHKLVAETFLPNPSLLRDINHKNGNKYDNLVTNLEWCSDEYNHEHATKAGLKARGESISTSKLTDGSVHAIKYFIQEGYSHSELSRAFKVSRATISLIHENKIWKHILL